MLPKRIPKAPKRETRWRSQAHCNFVRGHACSVCGVMADIQVAHVRLGSGAGMGQKPHDWFTVSLCGTCHRLQHEIGERTFWASAGIDPIKLAEAFAKASPRKVEILARQRELGL